MEQDLLSIFHSTNPQLMDEITSVQAPMLAYGELIQAILKNPVSLDMLARNQPDGDIGEGFAEAFLERLNEPTDTMQKLAGLGYLIGWLAGQTYQHQDHPENGEDQTDANLCVVDNYVLDGFVAGKAFGHALSQRKT